jgi:hypothetical protein
MMAVGVGMLNGIIKYGPTRVWAGCRGDDARDTVILCTFISFAMTWRLADNASEVPSLVVAASK